ncbi:MAG: hypothetical protein ACJ71G_13315, partial [Nitrososphaeraceae archaeon]
MWLHITAQGSPDTIMTFDLTGIDIEVAKKIKNTFQDSEAKMKTEEDHAEGKPSSEFLKIIFSLLSIH